MFPAFPLALRFHWDIAAAEKIEVLNGLQEAQRMGLLRIVNPLVFFEVRQFLFVPVGQYHSQSVAAHHVLIGTRAARRQDVIQRDLPAVGDVTQGQALGGAATRPDPQADFGPNR